MLADKVMLAHFFPFLFLVTRSLWYITSCDVCCV